MIQIDDMRLISTLAKTPSLSAAARLLGVTPPALSLRLKRLEASMGVNLAVRSAHRLGLTPEGEQLAAHAAELLARIEELTESLRGKDQALRGELRISAPFGFGREHIAPLLAQFARLHPQVRMHLDLLETPWPDRRNADVVIHIGQVRDSSWVAHLLADNERWLCASPGYVRSQRLVLAHPGDALQQRCICIRENEEDVTLWHYRKRGSRATAPGKRQSLRITPALLTNDGQVARRWAESGLGLVLRSQWDAEPAVRQGRLVRLLADWVFDRAPIVALVPNRKGSNVRVQALVASLRAAFASRPGAR